MNSNAAFFEKYAVAPCPSRDYYGIKVFQNLVILYLWKVSHGPHLSPVIREIKFSDFNENKLLKDEIGHVFGRAVLRYLEKLTSEGANTLLTLPRVIIEKLVRYLDLSTISKLLCTSRVSSEIFNTNSIWEILYKRSKGIPELTEMEKDLGASQGFRKLTKDHHLRNVTKKSLKETDEKLLHSKKMERNDKILRSASVNIPKTMIRHDDDKSPSKKHSIESNSKKVQRPLKSSIKDYSNSKRFDLPAQSSIFIDSRNFNEKRAAGEGYQNTKFTEQAVAKAKLERKDNELAKFQFVNEDDDKTELVLQKNYLKSAIMHSNLSDIDLEDATNKILKSPRSILTKQSCYTQAELKLRPRDKTPEPRKSKSSKKKLSKSSGASKTLTSSVEKSDDLEESGMSYLMKKYLAASDEVARKFSECERLAQSTRNSGIQVDMREKSERKPLKCAAPAMKQAQSRSGGDGANILSKLRSFKKN